MSVKKPKSDVNAELREEISEELQLNFGVTIANADAHQLYRSIARALVKYMNALHMEFDAEAEKQGAKHVYYMSVEYLMGRSMKNNLYNLRLGETIADIAAEANVSLEEIYQREPDAGLGNGGLGRLAACYMDGLTSQRISATGFSILYQFGIFSQKLQNGWQVELPDLWLSNGDVWLVPRNDEAVKVRMDGIVEEVTENGAFHVNYHDYNEISAVPYDMFITGYGNGGAANVLRLWSARAENEIDMLLFARGEYARAAEQKAVVESISKVLYPADDHYEGKSLRIRQQYFLVSASLQEITRKHFEKYKTFDNLPDKAAIHINDTHPAMCIPELMRILMDDHGYSWDKAFDITSRTLAYTNHTVMSEALERWPVELFRERLPRIYKIICEINRRLMQDLNNKGINDHGKLAYMAICNDYEVRMANLCLASVHAVNGVSALHSDILKERVFRDYYQYKPEIFTNVTNGIAHRRWLCQSNPELTSMLSELIGADFADDASKLSDLLKYGDDASVKSRLEQIKLHNKLRLADHIRSETGTVIDPSSMFDVQVKRLHEYKRQLLNALHIISLYNKIKADPNINLPPRTFIFGAKASAAYYTAKRIIKLIWSLSNMIAADPAVRDRMRVVFTENYSVSYAEIIIPAADLSEQISVAGKEASGTGNMKLMINGALTIGTLDGANIEIKEHAGDDNIFIFGMNSTQVEELWRNGYSPMSYYNASAELRAAIDLLRSGIAGEDYSDIAGALLTGNGGVPDPYMNCADFDSYRACQARVSDVWRDRDTWNRMSLANIAGAGFFAADRAVMEYADRIWHTPRVKTSANPAAR